MRGGDLAAGQVDEVAHHVEVLAAGEVLVDGGELPGEADDLTDLRGLDGRRRDPARCRGPRSGVRMVVSMRTIGGLAGAVGAEQPEHGAGGDR